MKSSKTCDAHNYGLILKKYNETIAVTGRGASYGCDTLELPHYLDSPLRGGDKVDSLARRPLSLCSPGTFLAFISLRGCSFPWVTVRLEGLKKPMASWRIELVTFRLLVQCHNQLRYRMLHGIILAICIR